VQEVDVSGKIAVKWTVEKYDVRCGLFQLARDSVQGASSCGHGDDYSNSSKTRNFFTS
jgi:hypothetical protein